MMGILLLLQGMGNMSEDVSQRKVVDETREEKREEIVRRNDNTRLNGQLRCSFSPYLPSCMLLLFLFVANVLSSPLRGEYLIMRTFIITHYC